MPPPLPHPSATGSPLLTLVIVFTITFAFFPNLFVPILRLPATLPFILFSSFPPSSSPSPSIPPSPPSSSPSPSIPPSPPPSSNSNPSDHCCCSRSDTMSAGWFQKTINLPPRSRGSYLVTDTITRELPELRQYKVGLLNVFMQHTSAALSLNENWDDDVRADMSDALDRIVPEDRRGGGDLYRHSCEGSDDMPAHIKSALIGASVTVPIRDGRLATGTWQGIWYLEFRAAKHSRKVVATIQGEKM